MGVAVSRKPSPSLEALVQECVQTPVLISAIEQGLPLSDMDALRGKLKISMEDLARRLAISKATLHRRKIRDGKLTVEEGDRLVRFAQLFRWATEVLESETAAQQWLSSPQFGLGGAVPLDYACTEVGARAVEDLLGRMEYGVYS